MPDDNYSHFKVVLKISCHASIGLHKDNLKSYLEYRLKMNSKDAFAVITLDDLVIEKIGGQDG